MSPAPSADSNMSADPMDAVLVVTHASGASQTISLTEEITSVGRSADNDIALPGDKRASRQHAEIRREAQVYVLYDLGSSNGAFVGQERVSHRVLQDGDEIRIGDALLHFTFRQPVSAASAPPAAGLAAATKHASGSDAAAGRETIEVEVDRLLVMAERAEREGDLAVALSLYQQSLTHMDPTSSLSREVLSICRELGVQQTPVHRAAADRLEAPPKPLAVPSAEESSDELHSMLERAEQMEQAGNIGGAVGLYQDLLFKLPASSPLRQEISMINTAAEARQAGRTEASRLVAQAERLEEQGDVEGALTVYRQAAAEAPPGSALRRELDLVIVDLESHNRDRVKMDLAAGHRAEGLAQAGRWADAGAAYEELLADTSDPAIQSHWQARLAQCQEEMVLADLFQRGVKATQSADWTQAQQSFNQIVRRRPSYQYNGQMAAMWLMAVNRRLSPARKPRLALWSAAGGVLVLLLLIGLVAGAFAYTRYRAAATATAVANRVATLQAVQTLTAVAALPSPTPPLTPTPAPTPTLEAPVVPGPSLAGAIAFASDRAGSWDIYTMRPDGTELTRLTDQPSADTAPVWSPDGSRLAFVSDRDGNLDIYIMAADGSGVTRLTYDEALDVAPAWSPDGQRVVFASNLLTGGDNFDLWAIDVNSADVILVAVTASEPAWSPDGGRMAAVFQFPTVVTIGLAPVDGDGSPQPLLEMEGSTSPSWSPDGSRILFSAPAAGGEHVFLINADGSNLVDLSAVINMDGRQPVWSQDGQHVAFVTETDGNQDIWIAAVDGGLNIQLTTDPGKDVSPSWSR